ncbi:MAG: hypothetical protein OXJ52_05495 [Oligoflexia bacterium]|nr:hypothetical protein [Oligoflexia bacterium]
MDHMSNMMGSGGESGLTGSFSLRYKPMGFDEEDVDKLTYRARVGWMGDVNEAVQWTVIFTTDTEQSFGGIHPEGINFEQAYVAYSPMEGFSVKVGKFGWMPDFHKSGILYSEQLYKVGGMLKYNQAMDDMASWYGKVAVYELEESSAPLTGVTIKAKAGGHFSVSDDMMAGLYVLGLHDGLMNEGEQAKTLGQLGVHFNASTMPIPMGVFAAYLTDFDSLGSFDSYTAGLSLGSAGKATSTEMGDFGVAVNYYNIDEKDLVVSWLNEDYVGGAGEGVAVRAQYNPWDNTSLVAKYARNLAEGVASPDNLVAELMFVF